MVKVLLKFNTAIIREFPFSKNELTIGRKPDNDIVIDNPAVSGHHARIVKQGAEYILEDLNSTNGTFLHERKILKASLRNKDEVGVAKHLIVFLNDQEPAGGKPADGQPVSSDATVVMSAPSAAASRPAKPEVKSVEKVGGLRVVEGETTAPAFTMVGLTTYIGKSDQANIRLKGFFAPDMAGCVARKPEGYYLKALKEKSIKVNGQVLVDQALLKEGDLIEVANLKLMYFQQDANAPMSG